MRFGFLTNVYPLDKQSLISSFSQWLKENKLISTISPLSKKVQGERFQTKISLIVFLSLEKLRLVPLFAKIYCKGKKDD